jgi:hypothetical protein
MTYEHRQYLILKTQELNKVDFTQVLETSAETVRKSVDETKTFIKWENIEPLFTSQLYYKEGPYTHTQMLNILANEEWTEEIEEI